MLAHTGSHYQLFAERFIDIVRPAEAFTIGDSIDVLFELTKDENIYCIEIGCMLLRKSGNELALKLEVIDCDSLMALKDYVGMESGDPQKIEQEFIGFLTTI